MAESSIGQNVRTLEGHAAMSMKRTGPDDLRWIEIQNTTFRNWVNEQLPPDSAISDLETELANGIKLIALVEALQSKPIGRKICKNPSNQHQYLENLSIALDAIRKDKVKLVNIGAEDIVEGNLKLILGLIWHLILRYQIGKTKFPPKKMMLIWLQYALPKCSIKNFSSSWNDGVALHALIEFCRPGTCPNWEKLDPNKKLENCTNAMNIAKDKFDIPLVVRPEDLASPHLDELSGMTYLSYYMKQDSPGYYATLDRVKKLLHRNDINNFTTDWNDGQLVCDMVNATGGNITNTNGTYEEVLTKGLNAGKLMSIQPTITAKEMAQEKEEHLGIMAYAVKYLDKVPTVPESEKVTLTAQLDKVHVGNETKCKLAILDKSVDLKDVKVEVNGPNSKLPVKMNWSGQTADVKFTPTEIGKHKLFAYNGGNVIDGCPKVFSVISDRSKVSYHQIENCCAGIVTEIKVNAVSAGQGNLKVTAQSPHGQLSYPSISSNKGMHTANFIPTEVGDWKISVLYDEDHISGSPFNVNVFDPSQVEIYGLEGGTVGKELSFKADYSRAGKGDFDCSITHDGHQVPIHSASIGNAKHEIKFVPQGAGLYNIKGTFNNVGIKGSPYTLEIVDSSMVSVSGAGLELVPINKTTSFSILTKGAGGGEVKVNITSPSKLKVPMTLKQPESGRHVAQFTPKQTGDYIVNVTNQAGHVKGSPFICKAYDSGKVKVRNMPVFCKPDKLVEFKIDASEAGQGNLEIELNGKPDDCNIRNLGNQNFAASFRPADQPIQTVKMFFNKEHVEGSPWKVETIRPDSFTIPEANNKLIHVNEPATCTLMGPKSHISNIDIKVHDSKMSLVPHKIINKTDRSQTVQFTPVSAGTYKAEFSFQGEKLKNSPQAFKVYDPSAIILSEIPKLSAVGNKEEFTIDVSKSGDGKLKIKLNKGGLENKVTTLSNNLYGVSFVPKNPGQVEIDLTFNDRPIQDSPYFCNVMDASELEVRDLDHVVKCDTISSFKLQTPNNVHTNKHIEVTATSPNGESIPAKLIPQHDGDYKVEWTPTVAGRYGIDILYGNKQIDGSPFTVDVFDINKIRVEELYSTVVDEPAGFTVDFSEAGRAEHSITIVNPAGKTIPFELKENNAKNEISYIPTTPGGHNIFINYGGIEVPGTPIIQEVGDGALPTAHGDGLHKGVEDKPAVFSVDSSGLKGDLFVQVDGPNSIAKCNIHPESNGNYTVTYIPVETGFYDIIVKWNGRKIQGSPFHPKIVDPRKVRVTGGWQHFMDSNDRVHLVVNEEKRIPFDVSEAGPGKLTADVKDPHNSRVPVQIDTSSDGRNTLVFTPKVEGDHHINVYWSDHPLVGAPFLGHAVSKHVTQVPDATKIVLAGKGLKEAVVREEAEFRIDGSKAGAGKPIVNLTGVRTDIDVDVIPLGNNCYRCKYMPIIPGAYLLNITWNGRQLKGSPYKVTIIAAPQPQKVMVTGDGLKGGMIGKDLQLNIDTRKAGLGELTAHCVGPSAVAYCELVDNHDGIYKLTVRPQEAGRHVLQIKYGGDHILGSPYVLKIGSLPDASKVRVRGPGVEHGILATYQSKFLVETRGAGAGQLSVRIKGPKGAFQVEMYRDNRKDRNIICCYNPFETGLYIIQVKWSGVDVPGSPFQVQIVDTQQEYETLMQNTAGFLQNGYGFQDSPSPRHSLNQWRD